MIGTLVDVMIQEGYANSLLGELFSKYHIKGGTMGVALQVDKMSLAEKLETMEMLWDNLSHHVQDVAVPEWHTEVLAAREADLADGTARFDDWETAKETIRKVL